jgi:hypothetical protein
MLDGIKLLIERMESHPEEFFGELSYRWSSIMNEIAKEGPEFLDEEDLYALNRQVKKVRQRELSAKIMDEISTQERLTDAQEKFANGGKLKLSRDSGLQAKSFWGEAIAKPSGGVVRWSDVHDAARYTVERALDAEYEKLKGTKISGICLDGYEDVK